MPRPFNKPATPKAVQPSPGQKSFPFLQGNYPLPQNQQNQDYTNKLPFKKTIYKTLAKGALANFGYTFYKHDPSPLVIVTDVFADRIRGVNLHYLTYRYMKGMLAPYCGNPGFSYRFIKHDQFVVNAFRTYKKIGIRGLKILDCNIINNALTKVRSFNPQELNVIRQEIQKQLQAQLNPTAEQLAQQYQDEILRPQPQKGFVPLDKGKQQDGRRAFRVNPTVNQPGPMIPPIQQ